MAHPRFVPSVVCTAAALATLGAAQTSTQIVLDYNFNGIVHNGEAGLPDDANGFRSISDRALDFTGGVPSDSLLNGYQLEGTAGVLDIVHLGNRNTVDFGNRAFDAAPDGDDIGIQPAWLANPDQSTAQTSDLLLAGYPIGIDAPATASFLYQISNGGGTFDVVFDFVGGVQFTATLSGPDWFGGAYAGTGGTDTGNIDANLSITEGTVDLSAFVGEVLEKVTFQNPSNVNAGYAILAGRVDTEPEPAPFFPVPLAYNFNGIVHTGEEGAPDNPNGFRSISDRALDFRTGVPSDATLDKYSIVDAAGALDIVHLGNRNTVDSGNRVFDAAADGDFIGIQPNWLPAVDQTGPQVSPLTTPIALVGNSEASIIFQISNGGGSFDVTLAFQSGGAQTETISGGDWFGGVYAGTDATDFGNFGANLSITERTIDLGANAGELVTAVIFSNQSNGNAGYAILAMNISGCDTAGSAQNIGGGNGPTISTTATGQLGAAVDVSIAGAGSSAIGTMLVGVTAVPVPLNLVFPACAGDLVVSSPIVGIPANPDASGNYTLNLTGPSDPGFCGNTFYFQYGEIAIGPACPIVVSDTLGITFGY